MKFPTALLLLANVAVSLPFSSDLPPSFNDLQGSPMNDADSNDQGMDHVMNILKANLTSAVDQTMIKLDSILLLNGHKQVSHGLRLKINQFKEDLALSFEDDLRILAQDFRPVSEGTVSEEEQYEFAESVKAKWEDTLVTKLENLSNDVLPAWARSAAYVWKGVENIVLGNIKKFRKFVHRSYPKSQGTCSVPKPVLIGSNLLNNALSPLSERSLTKRQVIGILNFIGAIIGGILLVIGSMIIVVLYFVAYIIGGMIAFLAHLFGLYKDDYLDDTTYIG